jgi:hypothetical protein
LSPHGSFDVYDGGISTYTNTQQIYYRGGTQYHVRLDATINSTTKAYRRPRPSA